MNEIPNAPGAYHIASKTVITLELFELLSERYNGKTNDIMMGSWPVR